MAEAVFKESGEPIPLTCSWFNIPDEAAIESHERQLQPIENASGACF